jgi:hypothetical protein
MMMMMRLRTEELFIWQLPSKSTVYKRHIWDIYGIRGQNTTNFIHLLLYSGARGGAVG